MNSLPGRIPNRMPWLEGSRAFHLPELWPCLRRRWRAGRSLLQDEVQELRSHDRGAPLHARRGGCAVPASAPATHSEGRAAGRAASPLDPARRGRRGRRGRHHPSPAAAFGLHPDTPAGAAACAGRRRAEAGSSHGHRRRERPVLGAHGAEDRGAAAAPPLRRPGAAARAATSGGKPSRTPSGPCRGCPEALTRRRDEVRDQARPRRGSRTSRGASSGDRAPASALLAAPDRGGGRGGAPHRPRGRILVRRGPEGARRPHRDIPGRGVAARSGRPGGPFGRECAGARRARSPAVAPAGEGRGAPVSGTSRAQGVPCSRRTGAAHPGRGARRRALAAADRLAPRHRAPCAHRAQARAQAGTSSRGRGRHRWPRPWPHRRSRPRQPPRPPPRRATTGSRRPPSPGRRTSPGPAPRSRRHAAGARSRARGRGSALRGRRLPLAEARQPDLHLGEPPAPRPARRAPFRTRSPRGSRSPRRGSRRQSR